ncbi:hypothetical protein NE865_03543 [Phthorimaea operculella]|nr:hypothetical protein NE865_03543 [Phthorimaea operculella]
MNCAQQQYYFSNTSTHRLQSLVFEPDLSLKSNGMFSTPPRTVLTRREKKNMAAASENKGPPQDLPSHSKDDQESANLLDYAGATDSVKEENVVPVPELGDITRVIETEQQSERSSSRKHKRPGSTSSKRRHDRKELIKTEMHYLASRLRELSSKLQEIQRDDVTESSSDISQQTKSKVNAKSTVPQETRDEQNKVLSWQHGETQPPCLPMFVQQTAAATTNRTAEPLSSRSAPPLFDYFEPPVPATQQAPTFQYAPAPQYYAHAPQYAPAPLYTPAPNYYIPQAEKMTSMPTSSFERLISRLATPRELPTFGGDCIEWLHFKSAYEESSKVCQYSDSENLWRLRKALRGDAKEAVTDLLIGNTPPAIVMEALELRFGRSDVIMQRLTAQLRKLPTLPAYYQNELFNFAVKINNAVATIRALKQDDYLRSPELYSAITSKLPSTLIGKWTEYAFMNMATGQPKLPMLANFLKNEAEILCFIGVPQASTSDHKKVTEMATKQQRPDENRFCTKSIFTITSTEEQSKCKFCHKSIHLLPKCRVFKRAMRKDKWKFVKKHRLCFSCLGSARHDKDTCPAPVCDIDNCGMSHHRLLHWKKENSSQSADESRQTSPITSEEEATIAHVAHSYDTTATSATTDDISATRDKTLGTSASGLLKVIAVKLRGPSGIEVNTYALLDDAASVSLIDSDLADELGLQCESLSDIKFVDAFGLEVYQPAVPTVRAKISGQDNVRYNIRLRKACDLNLPVQDLTVINSLNYDYLSSIKDVVCKERVIPRLLISEDNYYLIAPLELIHGSETAPYATRTRLGWCIHGNCGRTHSHGATGCYEGRLLASPYLHHLNVLLIIMISQH